MLVKHFEKLMEILCGAKWISSISAKRAARKYKDFIDDENPQSALEKFSAEQDRLDEFYKELFSNFVQPCDNLVKLCLILSHCGVCVESGFSINKEILEVNMKEDSVVAQRFVYEGIAKGGGVFNVDINKINDGSCQEII